MWAAVVIVVLVCGYVYTNSHLPSRFKQNKAIGWNAYFEVARQGGFFSYRRFLSGFNTELFNLCCYDATEHPCIFWCKIYPFYFCS